jgi:hypothetical protein
MDYNKIEKLLEAYFEGNTSVSEENELKEFFKNSDIPEQFMYAKGLFNFYADEKSLKSQQISIKTKQKSRNMFLYISGIAASILIAMFFVFSVQTTNDDVIYAYYNGKPITDKVLAEKYTRQALLAMSQNLDKGTKNLNQLNQLNKVEMLIKKEK